MRVPLEQHLAIFGSGDRRDFRTHWDACCLWQVAEAMDPGTPQISEGQEA